MRSTARASRIYLDHSAELMPCMAAVASSRQRPWWRAATSRRAWSHNRSESSSTPSRSNTTARIMAPVSPVPKPRTYEEVWLFAAQGSDGLVLPDGQREGFAAAGCGGDDG